MADIFISYAHEDRSRIERLAATLEAEGLSVWWDRHIAGFRYPWSYDCDSCVHDGFYAEHGLFAGLLEIPEIAAMVERIEAENAKALDEFNKKYGVLDRVRAMMAARQ